MSKKNPKITEVQLETISDASQTKSLDTLIRNRASIKYKLTILEKFINVIKTSLPDQQPNVSDVELRFKNSTSLLSEFDEVESTIEELCTEEALNGNFPERELFAERYYDAQDFLSQFLENERQASGINESKIGLECQHQLNMLPPPGLSCSNGNNLQNILLTKLKLPTFSGCFDQWLNFKLNFSSTIASNLSLNDAQK